MSITKAPLIQSLGRACREGSSLYAEHMQTLATAMRAHAAEAENLAAGLSVEGDPDLIPHLQTRLESLCRPGERCSFDFKRHNFGGDGWKTEWQVSVVFPGVWPAIPVAQGRGDTPDAALEALIPELNRVRAEARAAEASAQSFDVFTK